MYEVQSAAGRGDTGEGKSDKSLHTLSPEHTRRRLRTPLHGHHLPDNSTPPILPPPYHALASPHSSTQTQATTFHPGTASAAPTCQLHVTHTLSAHTPSIYSLTPVLILVITISHPPSTRSPPDLHNLHLTVRSEGR